jgi:hypothetical protein
MIRYVINEHYPYYAYEQMDEEIPNLNGRTRRLARLYFRLANYSQALFIISFASPTSAYAAYMKAGCRKTTVVEVSESTTESYEKLCVTHHPIQFLRISPSGNYRDLYEKALSHTDTNSIIVIEDIYQRHETKDFWQSVVKDERTGETFDLYDCGIIFFDRTRYKKNYIINF